MIARDAGAPAPFGVRPPLFDVPKWRSPAFTKSLPRIRNATEELRVVFKTIVKPVVFRGEPNQDAGGPPMSGNHDFFLDCQAKVL